MAVNDTHHQISLNNSEIDFSVKSVCPKCISTFWFSFLDPLPVPLKSRLKKNAWLLHFLNTLHKNEYLSTIIISYYLGGKIHIESNVKIQNSTRQNETTLKIRWMISKTEKVNDHWKISKQNLNQTNVIYSFFLKITICILRKYRYKIFTWAFVIWIKCANAKPTQVWFWLMSYLALN